MNTQRAYLPLDMRVPADVAEVRRELERLRAACRALRERLVNPGDDLAYYLAGAPFELGEAIGALPR